jgi:signal transduction histidine kinase
LREFSLLGCLGDVLRMQEGQVRARSNRLVIDAGQDFKLRSDSQRLSQVLIHILTNANKFTSGGRIAVSCAEASCGDLAMVIEDDGIGMDEEELSLAVREFGRVSPSAFISRDQTGTGLGLPISIGLMKMLGGRLDIESRKGQGTRVRLVLPRSAIIEKSPAKVRFSIPIAGRPKLVGVA